MTTSSISHDVQVGDHFSFALGVGLDTYGDCTMVPLLVDVRSFIFTGQTSPFLFADAEYSLGKLKNQLACSAGGIVLNTGAGFFDCIAHSHGHHAVSQNSLLFPNRICYLHIQSTCQHLTTVNDHQIGP